MKNNQLYLKISILSSSILILLTGAIIAPILPDISKVFSIYPNAVFLSKLLISLPSAVVILLGFPIGLLSDKIGRKQILLFSLFIYGLGGMSGFFFKDIYIILIGRVFIGVGLAGIYSMATSLIGDFFDGKERTKMISLQGLVTNLGGVIFISLAGFLGDINWQYPFLIYGFSFIILIFSFFTLRKLKETKKKKSENFKKITYNKQKIFLFYFITFWKIVLLFIFSLEIPFLLKKINGVSNLQIAYYFSLLTLVSAISAFFYQKVKAKLDFLSIYILGILLSSVTYFALPHITTYFGMLIIMLFIGIASGLLIPNMNLWLISLAPKEIRGKFAGNLTVIVFLAQFISPILTKPILDITSVSNLLTISGFLLILISLIAFVFRNKIK